MESDLKWKSVLSGLSESCYSFAVRSISDSLPTNVNLSLWGKVGFSSCGLCGSGKETLLHVLNGCPVALPRFHWRHNVILLKLSEFISEHLKDEPSSPTVITDLEVRGRTFNMEAVVHTIPPDILVTNQRPDIVITDRVAKRVTLIELTVPFERNIESARDRKAKKYSSVIANIESSGFKCIYYSIEVGARGVIAHGTAAVLRSITGASRKEIKTVMKDLAMTVIKCSYLIFLQKDNHLYNFNFTME